MIIETARAHLRRFGEDKVTVVDIARALRMSHSNVYRFFKSKSDILDAVIDQWLSKMEALIEGIAQQPGSASMRLEAIVLELHRKRRKKLERDAEVYLTFRRLIESRPDAAAKRQEKIVHVFRKVIAAGIAAGEFTPVDCQEAATALEDATAIFLHPLVMPAALTERTEERARNVVRYILQGFAVSKSAEMPRRKPNIVEFKPARLRNLKQALN
jgi:AcrR family transcriptional regulator